MANKYEEQVFSKKWFLVHQSKILWFANTYFGRYILRIHGKRSGVGKNKILRIEPNAIWWKGENYKENERTVEFRSNDKFALRLYHAFKPIWWTMHFIDWLLFDRFEWMERWNFGFLTLTQYPGSIGANNPVDGYVARSAAQAAFSTLRAGAGNATGNAILIMDLYAGSTTNQFTQLERVITCFDTSSLTAAANISATQLSAYGGSKSAGLGQVGVDVVAATPAATNALANSDYGQLGVTSFGSIAYSSINNSAYNDITLDANGRANVSKTGISKFGMTLAWDTVNSFTGVWANGAGTEIFFQSTSASGTSQDPKLTVTYTTSTAHTKSCDEALSLVDSKTISLARAILETIVLADTIDILRAKNLLEALSLVDSKNISLSRSLAEVLTLADTKTLLITRAFLEAIILVDTKAITMGKAFLESLNLVDTIDLLPEKVLAEVLALIDTKGVEVGKMLLESIILVDTLLKTFGFSLNETITLSPILKAIINGLVGGIWTKQSKSSAVYTKQPKASATFTPQSKVDDPNWTPSNYI